MVAVPGGALGADATAMVYHPVVAVVVEEPEAHSEAGPGAEDAGIGGFGEAEAQPGGDAGHGGSHGPASGGQPPA